METPQPLWAPGTVLASSMVKNVFCTSSQNILFSTLNLLALAISPCIFEKSGSIFLCNLCYLLWQTREELLLKEEN